jgi:hypothetical protein
MAERSRLLDAWNWARFFAGYHVEWLEEGAKPAFEQDAAVGIALEELGLLTGFELYAQRAILLSFSSTDILVGGKPAEAEPAWVVILAGVKAGTPAATLAAVPDGGGVVVQCLIHGRTGEILLGRAVPVRFA